MTTKKTTAIILLTIGLIFTIRTIWAFDERQVINEIKTKGNEINVKVSYVECDKDKFVVFKTNERKEITIKLNDSNCGLFTIDDNRKLLFLEKYPDKYIFPNESIPMIGIIFSLGISVSFLLIGLLMIRNNKA